MGKALAVVYGVLDAFPFALGLCIVLLSVGDTFAPGRLLVISVLLRYRCRATSGSDQCE